MSELITTPPCADEERRTDLIAPPPSTPPPFVDLNGIDFLEVDAADHRILRITFLKPRAREPVRDHAGGRRHHDLRRHAHRRHQADRGRAGGGPTAARRGRRGRRLLAVRHRAAGAPRPRSRYGAARVFSFMASCPTDIDCRPIDACPPPELVEPLLDYLAKDYASFRRLLVDLLPTLNPDWTEQNPSDLGMALLELLAYEGDRLSYFQDAVANEAYLDTLRTRISARRHARLVDYRMHDGRNAWAPRARRGRRDRARRARARHAAVHEAARAAAGADRAARPGAARRLDHRRGARPQPRSRGGRRLRDRARRHAAPRQRTSSASTRGATRSAASRRASPRSTSTRCPRA